MNKLIIKIKTILNQRNNFFFFKILKTSLSKHSQNNQKSTQEE